VYELQFVTLDLLENLPADAALGAKTARASRKAIHFTTEEVLDDAGEKMTLLGTVFIGSPVVVTAAGVFDLGGVGIERFHESMDVLDLSDGHLDEEFGLVVAEVDSGVSRQAWSASGVSGVGAG
jgi:hypothetical protein